MRMRWMLLAGWMAGAVCGKSAEAQAPTPVAAAAAAQTQTQGTPAGISAADLTGSWQGTITLPPNAPPTAKAPRVLVKVTRGGAQGTPYKGTLYLVDQQNGRAIGAPAIVVNGSDVSFAIPVMSTTYTGTLSADGKTLSGSLKPQGGPGAGTPLSLIHVAEEDAWPTPQMEALMAKDAHPKFEVTTVKPTAPNGMSGGLDFEGHEAKWTGYTVEGIMALGYGLHADEIIGAPDWFTTQKWDVVGVPDTPGRPSSPQFDELSHDLLATRFGLKFHYEERELSAYVITVAKGGPKLEPTASGPDDSPLTQLGFGNATLHNMTIANFAKWFQAYVLDRPVIDRTGLTGYYDFTLLWAPDDSEFLQGREPGAAPRPPLPDAIAARPGLEQATLQQLGLKMEVIKTPVKVMVIDHAEKPSAN